jgi:hypothetical protein
MPRSFALVLVAASLAAPVTASAATSSPAIPAKDAQAIRALAEKYGRASTHGVAGAKVCRWLTADAQRRFIEARKSTRSCAATWDRAVADARGSRVARSARYELVSLKPLGLTPGAAGQIADRVAIRLRSIVTTRGRVTKRVGRLVLQRDGAGWLIDIVG